MGLTNNNPSFLDYEGACTPIYVNSDNDDALRAFFQEYDGLTTGELSVLCGRSNSTIRRWKHRIGLKMKPNPFKRNYTKTKRVEVELINDPPSVWDNRDWFYHQYVTLGHGVHLIARMLRKSTETIYSRLKQYQVPIRKHSQSVRPRNQCGNEAWLYYHYAMRDEYREWCLANNIKPDPNGGQGLALVACAKLAKVVPYTIFNWLVRYKIRIRDFFEAVDSKRLNKPDERIVMDSPPRGITQGNQQIAYIRRGTDSQIKISIPARRI